MADERTTRRAAIPDAESFRGLTNCRAACPVHTDARGYVKAIARGDVTQAYRIARASNPLASICGRICGAPCEVACRRAVIDAPIAIRALKRAASEGFYAQTGWGAEQTAQWIRSAYGGERPDDAPMDLTTKGRFSPMPPTRVAIVGSGPAGLAAAHDLALLGATVTVFEAERVAGGMLAIGIPAYRLPREVVQLEVDVIRHLGVEFRCGVWVGRDVTLPELRSQYDAVILAVGAKRSRMLDIPGIDAQGVLGGVDFLRSVALDESLPIGERVVVVGGGNVAFDVARSVVRQTQLDVALMAARRAKAATTVVCLESRAEMPADHTEILEGTEEGITLINRMGPEEILVEDGRVRGVRFREVTRVFDESGRFAPVFGERREVIECDTALLAIGQQPDLAMIDSERDQIALDARGMPVLDEELRTSAPDVWCAGDLAHGLKLAIHAVASGKHVARSIYTSVTGISLQPHALDLHTPLPYFERDREYDLRRRIELPTLPVEERLVAQTANVEESISSAQARFEASRCLDCSVHTIFDGGKCVLCGGCVDVCPEVCLKIAAPDGVELDHEARAWVQRVLGGLTGGLMLKDETSCIRCGLCASRCPVGAITSSPSNPMLSSVRRDTVLSSLNSGPPGSRATPS